MSDTLEAVFDALFAPLVKMTQEKQRRYAELFNKAIIGKHTAQEVELGVYEHTFTPPMRDPYELTLYASEHLYESCLQNGLPHPFTRLEKVGRLPLLRRPKTDAAKRKRRQHRAAFRRRKRGLA